MAGGTNRRATNSKGEAFSPLNIVVSVRGPDGKNEQQRFLDFNDFEKRLTLTRLIVWALLNGRSVELVAEVSTVNDAASKN